MADARSPEGLRYINRILIVRLGSLGDIVHALPVAAALRRALPDARIDWVVDERHRELLDLVPVVDRRLVWRTHSAPAWRSAPGLIAELRRARYDAVLDLQGLIKSAVLARAAGGRRTIGLPRTHLREGTASVFYSETARPPDAPHVVHVVALNLSLAAALGVKPDIWEFPLQVEPGAATAADDVRQRLGLPDGGRYAVLNPGAAWPNKRWPPERFGAIAQRLRVRHDLPVAVVWGPGEEALAKAVTDVSDGTATVTGRTTLAGLVAVLRDAALLVSGDTGPLHLAAAVSTPVVGIYGPTNPERNGPWAADDLTVSRFHECHCHHRRRCHAARWCVGDISVEEVTRAVDDRLAAGAAHA